MGDEDEYASWEQQAGDMEKKHMCLLAPFVLLLITHHCVWCRENEIVKLKGQLAQAGQHIRKQEQGLREAHQKLKQQVDAQRLKEKEMRDDALRHKNDFNKKAMAIQQELEQWKKKCKECTNSLVSVTSTPMPLPLPGPLPVENHSFVIRFVATCYNMRAAFSFYNLHSTMIW